MSEHDGSAPASTLLLRFSGDLSIKRGRAFSQFRRCLARNVEDALRSNDLDFTLRQERYRFYVEAGSSPEAAEALSRVFGVQTLSPVHSLPWSDLEDLLSVTERFFAPRVAGKTFAVRARRSGIRDQVDFSSLEIERRLGTLLLPGSRGVNLSRPEVWARMELEMGVAHCYAEVLPGPAGLPIGSEGRALVLISGGIDSAVAAWLLLKRGVQVDYLFYNLGGDEHVRQVLEIIMILAERWSYGYNPRLHLVDLRPEVEPLRTQTPERLWQIVLKRLMLRGAQHIVSRASAVALATGEAIGQVSSQTLANLAAVEGTVNPAATEGRPSAPILRPLLTFDKDEIVALARRIGTYELSAQVPEYCSLQGRAPATESTVAQIDDAEARLDVDAFLARVETSPRLDLRSAERSLRRKGEPLSIEEVPADATLLDLRPQRAFDSWHYPDAVRIDYLEALRAHDHFDADRHYVVCCEVEFKSADLAEKLRAAGRRAHYFKGGSSKLVHWAAKRDLVDPSSIAPAVR